MIPASSPRIPRDISNCLLAAAEGTLTPDEASRLELTDALLSLHAEAGFTLMVIEHDVRVVERVCELCIALEFGRLIAFGPTKEVFVDPEVRRALFGEVSA